MIDEIKEHGSQTGKPAELPVDQISQRQNWMGILAQADIGVLEAYFINQQLPVYTLLRTPEMGLVMVRARAGGTGDVFNFGEMTVTRCSVELETGEVGHAYIGGRRPRAAELAALADALLQSDMLREQVLTQLIQPLAEARRQADRDIARKAAATKVQFFTVKSLRS